VTIARKKETIVKYWLYSTT